MTEYRPYIKKLQFSKKIVDNDFNLTESAFKKFIEKWEKEFTILAKTILQRSTETN